MKLKKRNAEPENIQTVSPESAEQQPADIKTRKERKKDKIKKIVLASVAGLLAVALLTGVILIGVNDGWGKENNIMKKVSYGGPAWIANLNKDRVVATAGEHKLTNAQLQVLYALQVRDFVNLYGGYISSVGVDPTKPLSEQVYDKVTGLTWEKYFLQNALMTWMEYCAVSTKAEEADYEMPQEFTDHFEKLEETLLKSAKDAGFDSIESMLHNECGQNVRYDDYYEYLVLYYTHSLYAGQMMEKLEFADFEIEEYFEKNKDDLKKNYGVTKESGNFVDVRHILIMPEGGTKSADGKTTTYSEAEWEACRAEAQAIYDAWLAGEKTEDSFGALANEKSDDQNGNVTNGGLYENVAKGQMVKPFENWCFDSERKPGDTGLVRTDYGYHIMYFVDSEPMWYRYCLSGIKNQEMGELISAYVDQMDIDIDFSKIVLDHIELVK